MTNDLSSLAVGQTANFQPDDSAQSGSVMPKPLVASQATVVGSVAKEQVESGPVNYAETAPVVELKDHEPIPENVSSWMERLEQGDEIKLPQPVVQDDQILVQGAGDDVGEDTIVLPMTEDQVKKGLRQHLYSGARWLAEWCIRIAKKFHGHVVYRVSGVRSQT